MNIPIETIKNKRILVIGDLMLDIYLRGKANRISPEAPVPVVSAEKRELIPGGAANVMMNLNAMGCEVVGSGFIGDDEEGNFLLDALMDVDIDCSFIFTTPLSTIHKTRVLANGQHIVRYDFDSDFTRLKQEKGTLSRWVRGHGSGMSFDAVIVSDYNKGTVSLDLMNAVVNTFACPILCDIKPCHRDLFSGVWCITPNLSEAKQMLGYDNSSDIFAIARSLKYKMDLRSIVITLADKGILLIDENDQEVHYQAYTSVDEHDPTQRFDVTGAGDTVISVLAACKAAGISTREAVFAANVAAGIVVNKIGTAVCSFDELSHELAKTDDGLVTQVQ